MSLSEEITNIVNSYISDPAKVYKKLDNISEMLGERVKKTGHFLEVDTAATVFFVGDLHGDLPSLKKVMTHLNYNLLEKKEQEIVFLGDYVDRGLYQLETLLHVLELWSMYPDSTIPLRGNHEPLKHAIPSPHDFPQELYLRYGFSWGVKIYEAFSRLVENLPFVCVLNKEVISMHGGLPTVLYNKAETLNEYLSGKSDSQRVEILTELLWNDPIEDSILKLPSHRGIGYLWGTVLTNWVLEKFHLKLIIRGHEAVDSGYKFNHSGSVLTLFTVKGYPYDHPIGAYAVIDFSKNDRLVNLYDIVRFI